MVVVHFIIQWVIDDGGEGDVHEEISLGPPAIASSSKTFHIKRLLGWIYVCIPLKHERVFFFECSQAAITSVRTRLQMMFFTAIENRANGTPIMFFYFW